MQIMAFTVIIHMNSSEFTEKSLIRHCAGSGAARRLARCCAGKKDMPVLKGKGDGGNGLKKRMKKIWICC